MQIMTEFGSFAWYFFLTIIGIFIDKSVNSTVRNKKCPDQNGDQK